MRNGFTLRLEMNEAERENIADLIFDMRARVSETGRIHSLFTDADLLREAVFAWTEKQIKLSKKKSNGNPSAASGLTICR